MRAGDLAYLRSFMVSITVEVLGADRCTPRCHPGSPGRPRDTHNAVCKGLVHGPPRALIVSQPGAPTQGTYGALQAL